MRRPDPIWGYLRDEGRYNLVWLAQRTGYSHSHVKALASGVQRPGPRFRAACARVLKLPEGDLFHGSDDSSVSAPESPDGSDSHAGFVAGALYPIQEASVVSKTA